MTAPVYAVLGSLVKVQMDNAIKRLSAEQVEAMLLGMLSPAAQTLKEVLHGTIATLFSYI